MDIRNFTTKYKRPQYIYIYIYIYIYMCNSIIKNTVQQNNFIIEAVNFVFINLLHVST